MSKWQIWIDRGGTFTDIVAKQPDGTLITHKLLSENPERYKDAAVHGIRELLRLAADETVPMDAVEHVAGTCRRRNGSHGCGRACQDGDNSRN